MSDLSATGWFDLETAAALWQARNGEPDVSYGRELYGGCLEPGYREQHWTVMYDCPECRRYRLTRRDWEAAEGGSLNSYWSEDCDACGYHAGNGDSEWDYEEGSDWDYPPSSEELEAEAAFEELLHSPRPWIRAMFREVVGVVW